MRASTQYDNIHGSGVSSAISFSCLHGGGPPTNATATPILRNITVQNMALTGVVGDGYGVTGRTTCAYIQTLQESPIDGLFLKNISIAGSCNAAFACNSFSRTDVGARGERKWGEEEEKYQVILISLSSFSLLFMYLFLVLVAFLVLKDDDP